MKQRVASRVGLALRHIKGTPKASLPAPARLQATPLRNSHAGLRRRLQCGRTQVFTVSDCFRFLVQSRVASTVVSSQAPLNAGAFPLPAACWLPESTQFPWSGTSECTRAPLPRAFRCSPPISLPRTVRCSQPISSLPILQARTAPSHKVWETS